MIITNLTDTKNVKRKASIILRVASLVLLMQTQPLFTMEDKKEINEAAEKIVRKHESNRETSKLETSQGKLKGRRNPRGEDNAFKNLKLLVDELRIEKEGAHLDKLQKLLASDAFTKMGKDEAQEYKEIVNSVKSAKVPLEIKQALAKKLLQETDVALDNVANKKDEAGFTALLNIKIKKIIEREENKEEARKKTFENFKKLVDELRLVKEGSHLDKLQKLLESQAFTKMGKDEAQEYRNIVNSVTSAKVSPTIRQALAKKLLEKTSDKLGNFGSDESKIVLIQSLNREIKKIIEQQERKEEEIAQKLGRQKGTPKLETSQEKFKGRRSPRGEDNAFKNLKLLVDELHLVKEGTHLDKLQKLLESQAFTKIGKDEAQEYRNIVNSVTSAKVSPTIRQALAKKLLEKTSEKLNNVGPDGNEIVLIQSLNREIKKIIEQQERKEEQRIKTEKEARKLEEQKNNATKKAEREAAQKNTVRTTAPNLATTSPKKVNRTLPISGAKAFKKVNILSRDTPPPEIRSKDPSERAKEVTDKLTVLVDWNLTEDQEDELKYLILAKYDLFPKNQFAFNNAKDRLINDLNKVSNFNDAKAILTRNVTLQKVHFKPEILTEKEAEALNQGIKERKQERDPENRARKIVTKTQTVMTDSGLKVNENYKKKLTQKEGEEVENKIKDIVIRYYNKDIPKAIIGLKSLKTLTLMLKTAPNAKSVNQKLNEFDKLILESQEREAKSKEHEKLTVEMKPVEIPMEFRPMMHKWNCKLIENIDDSEGCKLHFIKNNTTIKTCQTPGLLFENSKYKLFVRKKNNSVENLDPLTVEGICRKRLDQLWKKQEKSSNIFLKYTNSIMQAIISQAGHTFLDPSPLKFHNPINLTAAIEFERIKKSPRTGFVFVPIGSETKSNQMNMKVFSLGIQKQYSLEIPQDGKQQSSKGIITPQPFSEVEYYKVTLGQSNADELQSLKDQLSNGKYELWSLPAETRGSLFFAVSLDPSQLVISLTCNDNDGRLKGELVGDHIAMAKFLMSGEKGPFQGGVAGAIKKANNT